MLICTESSLFSCAGKGFVYNHKLCLYWSRWISTIQKHKRTIDLQKGICLKSLWFMFQRIIFSCQHETELNLTVQFQAVSVAPLAEWYNLSGLCQDHNSEAESMLKNWDLNQLECLGTYSEMVKETLDSPDLILSDTQCVLVLHIAPIHQKNDKMSQSFQHLK